MKPEIKIWVAEHWRRLAGPVEYRFRINVRVTLASVQIVESLRSYKTKQSALRAGRRFVERMREGLNG